jgi:hypothetical protein
MTSAVAILFYSAENRRYIPYHDRCSAHDERLNAATHHFRSHDISVFVQYLYLLIIFLLFFIKLNYNRFARNLFKRSQSIKKLLAHLVGTGPNQVASPGPNQVATGSFSFNPPQTCLVNHSNKRLSVRRQCCTFSKPYTWHII